MGGRDLALPSLSRLGRGEMVCMDERGGRMEVLLVQTVKYIRRERGCCERSEI